MAFARLSFAAHDFAGASSRARSALAGFTANGREGDRLAAASLLARALIAQGNAAEASKTLAQIPAPDAKKLPCESVLQFRIAHSLILANAGRRQEAEQAMDTASADAAQSGVPKLMSEALQAKKALKDFRNPAP
jgi:thioredoxin-like negative regulator of GroEL